MTRKFKVVRIGERDELEPIIVSNPDVIEEGLRVLAHQQLTDSGPLDILGVDAEGTLVVIELKDEATDSHLDQGLRYYDWCRQSIPWIATAYPKYKIHPESAPRLLLIAPSFSENVIRIAKYIDVKLELIEYKAVEDEKGQKGIICTAIDFGQPTEPPEIPTLAKKLEYIQDNKVKAVFKTALETLESRGVEIKLLLNEWFSFWYKNKRFMYVAVRRNFFLVQVLAPDASWLGRERVKTKEDWRRILEGPIAKYMKYLDSE